MCASSNVEILSMQPNAIGSMNNSILDDLNRRDKSITIMNWWSEQSMTRALVNADPHP